MKTAKKKPRRVAPPGWMYVFRPWITSPSGQILWARNYGLKAWPILVPVQ